MYGPKGLKQLVQKQGNVIQFSKAQMNRPGKKQSEVHQVETQPAKQ